jgi:hypothetical protein
MSNQVDQLPYYDPIIKPENQKMSEIWIAAVSAFIETLNGYLSQFGMFLPQLTNDQRNSIQSPVNGQIIYNTTINSAQYFKNGVWTSF